MNLIEKVLAALIERVCKNWITTAIGVLVGLVGAIVGATQVIPAALIWHGMNVRSGLDTVATVIGAVALILAKDKGSKIDLPKVGIIVLALVFWPVCAQAQSAPDYPPAASTSNGFAASSDAVAIYYGGGWSAGTHIVESYDFLDYGATKGNHLYVEGHELIAPGPGFNAYLGGIKLEPDFSAIAKKTNLPAGNFGVSFSAAIGNGIPSSGGSHISFLVGGGVKYDLTNSLSWKTLQANYGQFGNNRFAEISTGLAFVFGGKS